MAIQPDTLRKKFDKFLAGEREAIQYRYSYLLLQKIIQDEFLPIQLSKLETF